MGIGGNTTGPYNARVSSKHGRRALALATSPEGTGAAFAQGRASREFAKDVTAARSLIDSVVMRLLGLAMLFIIGKDAMVLLVETDIRKRNLFEGICIT